jgi:hypothetical protein
MEQWRPRAGRAVVELSVALAPADGASGEGTGRLPTGGAAAVCNVSQGGFSGWCETTPPIGALLVADLPGVGRIPAQIRWALGRRFGARFARPLTAAEEVALEALLAPAGRAAA